MNRPYYLAGPMTNIAQFNFPAFHAAATRLRELGFGIISPAEEDAPEVQAEAMKSLDGKMDKDIAGHTWGDILSKDVKIVSDLVKGIIFLPGWEKSRGARLEAFVAMLCKHEFAEYCPMVGISPRSVEWVKERLL
jgi:hypothetical protein